MSIIMWVMIGFLLGLVARNGLDMMRALVEKACDIRRVEINFADNQRLRPPRNLTVSSRRTSFDALSEREQQQLPPANSEQQLPDKES